MPSKVTIEGNIKTIVETTTNEKGQKVEITRRIKLVNPAIAHRRTLAKFGEVKHFGAGPDSNSTTVGDDVFLKLSSNSKDLDGPDEEELKRVASLANSKIVCRICKGDHWTTKCPFKDTHVPVNEIAAAAKGTFDLI
jgi:translation initiation factor 3 subunit G